MIIEKDITKYIVKAGTTIGGAINHLIASKARITFVVGENGILIGLVTNGDLLRWLANKDKIDLNQDVSEILHGDYIIAQEDDRPEQIVEYLVKVRFVPIVDELGRLIAVARDRGIDHGLHIGDQLIHEQSGSFIIAEIGNNHNGNFQLAMRLIEEAVETGADCAKFQMRHLDALYANAGDSSDPKENLGSQYTLDLLSRFQLSNDQMLKLFDRCKELGIIPLCTPWDQASLKILEDYGMPAYKVASADLTNHDLLAAMAKTGKPLICSTGMSTEAEITAAVDLLQRAGAQYILLHCNSTYPAPFKDINLRYLTRLKEIGQCLVGYSGHERGSYIAVGAVAMGAKVIEKHFTVDRNMEGNDHKVSLLPDEFRDMVQQIRDLELALGTRGERVISQGEMMNRVSLAKSLIAKQPLKAGDIIEESMVDVKSPGRGLQPNFKKQLVGRKAKHDFKAGDFFYPSDIEDAVVERRPYHYSRPWGIPVRYFDFNELIKGTNPDLVEFHLSYKDMEVDFTEFVAEDQDIGFVVHSPELFANDHTLDLCTPDEAYRKHSVAELQRVIEVTRALKERFPKTEVPLIIVNVGGFSQDDFLSSEEKTERYALLARSLSELDREGVELIPQTMPPFPWHFGGQRFHNLFVHADEIVAFCKEHQLRICLDTSHSKLACTHYDESFVDFLRKTVPVTAHLHFADAEKTGGEGLQIGEGEIDFYSTAEIINTLSPDASFIPEIWQGHENNGEGGWIALERLETYLNQT